mmetsp:Transcript_34212/g.51602  ORF Transcript_34212/g.51602 Transcript_34212/m.51602 type:complete len:303 (+) Transcript_34212:249-1157(+)|eukprot:CAMPEP_0194750362 /NCGR_PEP_ID=MMETSP0323_2-20130528/4417_1 /TAXON_ID=2866 ORGANISM="Crypthecodinium cohnii, Strain Seligo" /NCGR_SAMPLE_ID=MMETSP0323_2 /ASSEMBLY_ACC=CAM_ASM_000346 /LENGTH=302 /DNA_ID=CAMNT_0039666011 /DNA_START=170 /DNA_END=1078 /DNA_ORIENTATION=-
MDVDEENVRWATSEDANVAWVDSAEGLLQAVTAGFRDIEVGAADTSVLDAIAQVAPHLRSLSLTGCNLDGIALGRLGRILAATQLEGIGISNNPDIDSACWVDFWQCLPTTLVKYDFGDNDLVDEVLPKLVAVIGRGPVRELFLDGNNFFDISPVLPLLAPHYQMTELDLGDNDVANQQMPQLAQAVAASGLATLVLGRNSINDEGAVFIAQALPHSQLTTLHLDSTWISDGTVDTLLQVLPQSRLEELHMDETKVTDASMLRLCQVLPQSRITMLDVSETGLAEGTLMALRQALPPDALVA